MPKSRWVTLRRHEVGKDLVRYAVDPWHIVQSSGTADIWVLQSPWIADATIGGGGRPTNPAVWKSPWGMVNIIGAIDTGATVMSDPLTSPSRIMTLPRGYRPEYTVSFPCVGARTGSSARILFRVDVQADGDVVLADHNVTWPGAGDTISALVLDIIEFRVVAGDGGL